MTMVCKNIKKITGLLTFALSHTENKLHLSKGASDLKKVERNKKPPFSGIVVYAFPQRVVDFFLQLLDSKTTNR